MTHDRAAFLAFNAAVDRARAAYYASTATDCPSGHGAERDSRGRCPICNARRAREYRARKKTTT